VPLTQRQKDAARRVLARKRRVPSSTIGDAEILAAVNTSEINLTEITQAAIADAGSAAGFSSDTGSADPGGCDG
jgi:hypothetical protein